MDGVERKNDEETSNIIEKYLWIYFVWQSAFLYSNSNKGLDWLVIDIILIFSIHFGTESEVCVIFIYFTGAHKSTRYNIITVFPVHFNSFTLSHL